MAKTFNESVIYGLSYDTDYGYFDGPDVDYIEPSTGIASEEAFGSFTSGGNVYTDGIASAEVFGSTNLTRFGEITTGIDSEEAFGVIQNVYRTLNVSAGIASEETFGLVTFGQDIYSVTPIPSAEAFGSVTLQGNIEVTGIASLESFEVGYNIRTRWAEVDPLPY